MKKKSVFFIFILLSFTIAFSEPLNVNYYGVVSKSSDSAMMKMAQDAFFNQIKSIENVSVSDKRPDSSKVLTSVPEVSSDEDETVAFYAEISEFSDSGKTKWKCKFNKIDSDSGESVSTLKSYESCYKILVSSKSVIENILFEKNDSEKTARSKVSAFEIENLVGNWEGEPFADKIIILHGGKGFVVFKGGTSMSISVSAKSSDLEGNITDIEISQIGKPKESSIETPILWNFTVSSEGTLSGTKTTFVPSGNTVKKSTEKSVWTRK